MIIVYRERGIGYCYLQSLRDIMDRSRIETGGKKAGVYVILEKSKLTQGGI